MSAAAETGLGHRHARIPPASAQCSSKYRLFLSTFGRRCSVESNRGVLFGFCRVRGVEVPVTLLNSASPFVPGNCDTDMISANSSFPVALLVTDCARLLSPQATDG